MDRDYVMFPSEPVVEPHAGDTSGASHRRNTAMQQWMQCRNQVEFAVSLSHVHDHIEEDSRSWETLQRLNDEEHVVPTVHVSTGDIIVDGDPFAVSPPDFLTILDSDRHTTTAAWEDAYRRLVDALVHIDMNTKRPCSAMHRARTAVSCVHYSRTTHWRGSASHAVRNSGGSVCRKTAPLRSVIGTRCRKQRRRRTTTVRRSTCDTIITAGTV